MFYQELVTEIRPEDRSMYFVLARQSRNQSVSAARYQLSAISGQLFNKGSEHALHFGGLLLKVVMEGCIEQS